LTLYHAQLTSGNVTCAVTGGALALTTLVMLVFYIKRYIDAHKPELGILKALGYGNWKIAKNFWVFGFSVFAGTSIGFGGAFIMMPAFYREMRSGGILPDAALHFNPELVLFLVILPASVFAVISVIYGYLKLNRPVLELIRDADKIRVRRHRRKDKERANLPFLKDLKQNTLRSRFSLVFFIAFASFCYSSCVQMSMSMYDMASAMMAVMMAGIGILLAITALFIAASTVIKGNAKTIVMLRVFGYSDAECSRAVLDGYRPTAYVGFVLGTGYQYGLLRVMTALFYAESAFDIPEYNFNTQGFFITLVSFVAVYEIFMRFFSAKIKRVSLKEVMLEE